MPARYPNLQRLWNSATNAFTELFQWLWRWTTRTGWSYDEKNAQNLYSTVITLFGIIVTLTLALGAAVWGSATNRYVMDDNEKGFRLEVSFEDENSLNHKLYAYWAMSGICLLAMAGITRMKSVNLNRHAFPVHRADRSSVRAAFWMFLCSLIVVGTTSVAVSNGQFPGEKRPGEFVVAHRYKFLTDGKDGVVAIVHFTISGAEHGQKRATVTMSPELNREWDITYVDAYKGKLDPSKWDNVGFEPPQDIKLATGPFIQDDPDATYLTRELGFVGIENKADYTLVFRIHPRSASARQDAALKFMRDNPATSLTVK